MLIVEIGIIKLRKVIPNSVTKTNRPAGEEIFRVGNEDNLWPRKGERFRTVRQVERAVRISREIGGEIATCEEARRIMKIATWVSMRREMPLNLSLLPRRKGGQRGFVGYGDDGEGARRASITAPDSHPTAYGSVAPEHKRSAA